MDLATVFVATAAGVVSAAHGIDWVLRAASARQRRTTVALRWQHCLFALVAAFAAVAVVHYDAHVTAAELGTLLAQSPKGAFTTPSGLTRLCGDVAALAEGRLASLVALLVLLVLVFQAFCIPLTFVVTVFAGALVDVGVALPLCVAAALAGATCCYLMSSVAGVRLASAVDRRLTGGRGVGRLQDSVAAFRGELQLYLIVIRLSPVFPPWLFNLGCPVAGVPLPKFALATLCGLVPQMYFGIRVGTVARAGTLEALVNWRDMAALTGLAVLLLAVHRLQRRFTAGAP